mmetsp:Transcript_59616/g.177112  ORF Transcript_59616/g.177112 Transcript_59616/m.177112 type:complete len:312 (+) Transcript_59616:508-1443(+)
MNRRKPPCTALPIPRISAIKAKMPQMRKSPDICRKVTAAVSPAELSGPSPGQRKSLYKSSSARCWYQEERTMKATAFDTCKPKSGGSAELAVEKEKPTAVGTVSSVETWLILSHPPRSAINSPRTDSSAATAATFPSASWLLHHAMAFVRPEAITGTGGMSTELTSGAISTADACCGLQTTERLSSVLVTGPRSLKLGCVKKAAIFAVYAAETTRTKNKRPRRATRCGKEPVPQGSDLGGLPLECVAHRAQGSRIVSRRTPVVVFLSTQHDRPGVVQYVTDTPPGELRSISRILVQIAKGQIPLLVHHAVL